MSLSGKTTAYEITFMSIIREICAGKSCSYFLRSFFFLPKLGEKISVHPNPLRAQIPLCWKSRFLDMNMLRQTGRESKKLNLVDYLQWNDLPEWDLMGMWTLSIWPFMWTVALAVLDQMLMLDDSQYKLLTNQQPRYVCWSKWQFIFKSHVIIWIMKSLTSH